MQHCVGTTTPGALPRAGLWSSHVGAGLHFSVLDQLYAKQALFPFPGAAQIVISVWDRVLETGIFESDDEASGFRGFRLDVAKP